jgi:probable rRNA maturation factor
VEIVQHAGRWSEAGLCTDALLAAAQAAWAAAGRDVEAEVAVVLADDAEVRRLNRPWAGQDKATDVLSFPAGVDGGDEPGLGDIVLACETVARDAALAGLVISDHASHLVIHGMLHLLGYDHAGETEAAAMEALETEILAGLGLHDPYAAPTVERA